MRIRSIVTQAELVHVRRAGQFGYPLATRVMRVTVHTASGVIGHGEAVPYGQLSGESLPSALGFVETHREEWIASLTDLLSLKQWINQHPSHIDANPSAWTAMELACLDALGKENTVCLEELLGLPPPRMPIAYTAIVQNGTPQRFDSQLTQYICAGFRQFKVHLSGDLALDRTKTDALDAGRIAPSQICAAIDQPWGNVDEAIEQLQALDFPFWAIEEPLLRADLPSLSTLANALGVPIILDQSFTLGQQLGALATQPGRWIVKVRASKQGGLLRCLAIIARARALGIDVMLGSHRGETPMLERATLALCAAPQDALRGLETQLCEVQYDPYADDGDLRAMPGGYIDASIFSQRAGHGMAPTARQ